MITNTKLQARNIFFNSQDAITMCSWISIIFALVFFVLVQFLPKIISRYVLYAGCGILFLLIILTFTYSTPYTKPKILVGLLLICFLIIVGITIFLFQKSIDLNGIFLEYSTKFVKETLLVLINIPIFLGLFFGFAVLLINELNSIWTSSSLKFYP